MPAHKAKNYRFRILDECFQNSEKSWTLEELIDEVSLRLSEEFDVQKVSKRSIQYDIALMRENQPTGYNAPIVCIDGKYSYSDPNFTIQNEQLSLPDIENLNDVVKTLKQYKNYPHLSEVLKAIDSIEAITSINPQPKHAQVMFESYNFVQGNTKWLKDLFTAIEEGKVLEITLKTESNIKDHIVIHPYFLKEYNNNWYLYGLCEPEHKLTVISCKKILAVSPQIITYIENKHYNYDFFSNFIGTDLGSSTKPTQIHLKIDSYLAQKFQYHPLHHTQEIEDLGTGGAILKLFVIPNLDLQEIILMYGSRIKVEAPDSLRKQIMQELKISNESYYKLSLF